MSNLGGFSEEALLLFQLAASEQGYDFSEGGDTYDFARCVRPDGTFYGTGGTCKKGSPAGAKEKAEPRTEGGKKRRATAEGKAAARAASRKAAGEKVSEKASRTRRFKEELEKVRDKMKGASPEEQNRLITEASKKADQGNKDARKPKTTATPGMAANVKAAKEKMVKDLQDRSARGDREAMDTLKKLRSEGKIGKEPGFAPGQKARNEAKETTDVKPARKPRATAGELQREQQKLGNVAKEKRAAARAAEKAHKALEKELKNDRKNPENRKRLLETGRAWDKATTAAERAERSWNRAYDRWAKASETQKPKKRG